MPIDVTTARGSLVEIQSVMVLSTCHVTKETADQLNAERGGVFGPHFQNEYGWIWYVPPDDAHTREVFPPEFLPIFDLARALDCSWVRFDCDGTQIEELSFYEW